MADYKKPDYWQQKARKEGYPARSVYKLKEIDEKFGFFKTLSGSKGVKRVLDIGAAPGSWSLYTLRTFKKGFLAAVDLSPLSREFDRGLFDNDNFFFIQGDVTAADVRETLLLKGPYSIIISDAAPSTTGNNMVDSARSLNLAEIVIDFAEEALESGGSLAVKVFQGGGIDVVLKRLKTIFKTAKSYKPEACRGESVETYFIGLGKKG
ncbi:MAG: RlmE family RNA methyltransferase [Treponema sp.]|nr:RlmE family RNA methyltransferase [Treponema sp.]